MALPRRQAFLLVLLLTTQPSPVDAEACSPTHHAPPSIARVEQVYPLAYRYRMEILQEIVPAPVPFDAESEPESLTVPCWFALPLEAPPTFPTGRQPLYVLMSLQR